jgi:hypothetical protein
MRLPRMRLRVWIALVLVTALVLAGGIWGRKMAVYRLKAQSHAADELSEGLALRLLQGPPPDIRRLTNDLASQPGSRDLLVEWNGQPLDIEVSPIANYPSVGVRREADACAERIAYHSRMRRKYERAARFPWLPVEPDPPEPK